MASTYLSRTLGTPTNAYKGTLSYWQKGASTTATNYILACESGNERMLFYMAAGKFQAGLRGTSSPPDIDFTISGTPRFRDLNSWYHVVLAWDSTQSTASDRMKLYVNNVQYTWLGSGTGGVNDIPQNHVMPMNKSGLPFRIGSTIGGSSYFEGVMSHIHFVDGTAYTPSTFGETDSTTGEWKIKTDPSVTYGNNGFWWLKDTNAATDSSPNSNTPSISGTLTKTEDNPSNVFATLNPLATSTTSGSFSNGNTTHAKSNSTWASTTSTLAASSGKYYAEYKFTANSSSSNGQMAAIVNMDLTNYMNENSDLEQNGNKGITYYANGTVFADNQQTVATYSSYGDAIIQIAMDLDNGFLYFGKDGTWQNSGVPTSGSTGTGGINISNYIGAGTYAFGLANRNTGATSVNFGNGYFGTTAVSSAGTNASNNGIFEYDVPTGYTALSTKGLNL